MIGHLRLLDVAHVRGVVRVGHVVRHDWLRFRRSGQIAVIVRVTDAEVVAGHRGGDVDGVVFHLAISGGAGRQRVELVAQTHAHTARIAHAGRERHIELQAEELEVRGLGCPRIRDEIGGSGRHEQVGGDLLADVKGAAVVEIDPRVQIRRRGAQIGGLHGELRLGTDRDGRDHAWHAAHAGRMEGAVLVRAARGVIPGRRSIRRDAGVRIHDRADAQICVREAVGAAGGRAVRIGGMRPVTKVHVDGRGDDVGRRDAHAAVRVRGAQREGGAHRVVRLAAEQARVGIQRGPDRQRSAVQRENIRPGAARGGHNA